MTQLALLIKLLMGHALADFALQSEWMARHKNRHLGRTFEPGSTTWPLVLFAHALIHGGAVWFITGNIWLGCAEVVAHFLIDLAKCEYVIGIYADQWMHVMCKVLWTWLS